MASFGRMPTTSYGVWSRLSASQSGSCSASSLARSPGGQIGQHAPRSGVEQRGDVSVVSAGSDRPTRGHHWALAASSKYWAMLWR